MPDANRKLQEPNDTPAEPKQPESDLVAKDGIDRRNFLSCMAWAGTGLLWTMAGGVPTSKLFAATAKAAGAGAHAHAGSEFSFVQISDSHIGFNKAANQDVAGTLKLAIGKINALAAMPDLLLHTGDITQSSKPAEFDTAQQIIKEAKAGETFYVPGEHDTATDDGAQYKERFGKGTVGNGWYSFQHKGVHFIGLNNVLQIDAMGKLGPEQLRWLKDDLVSLSASTPIVVFAHIPLWMVYPQWGWGTQDGAEALSYLKRFGSVTVLNGHIHQIVQKVEGNVAFHTATSTAFPQPAPGSAAHAGPMVVPAGQLESVLGVTKVRYIGRQSHLAIVDSSLAEKA
ncbi:MAG: metallophosphoesterase family protein [Candidatus Sulfotelmatobacter sp.]